MDVRQLRSWSSALRERLGYTSGDVKFRTFFLLLLLAACAKESPLQHPGPPRKPISLPPASDAEERGSVINFGRGSCVVSRTGEALLSVSSLAAIDGDPTSYWMNPPGDLPQSMVISLAAKTRIEKIGIRSVGRATMAKNVAFEVSNDGRSFTPLATIAFSGKSEVQWQAVQPAAANYVRATIEPVDHDVRLVSILAHGKELEPPRPPRIAGCWFVNEQRPASFVENGARVTGTMEMPREKMTFDGGNDGRIVRLEWIRGREFGYAVITTSPDGTQMSGIEWHEEPIPIFFADAWFAGHADCPPPAAPSDVVATSFLEHTGRHSLYGLRFRDDGSLDVALSGDALKQLSRLIAGKSVRLVAHEFREADAGANRARAQRELDALKQQLSNEELGRVTFVAAGSDNARQIPPSEAARELYSTVDLEVGR